MSIIDQPFTEVGTLEIVVSDRVRKLIESSDEYDANHIGIPVRKAKANIKNSIDKMDGLLRAHKRVTAICNIANEYGEKAVCCICVNITVNKKYGETIFMRDESGILYDPYGLESE